ncbi:MAG: tetraacyldisaccharide 4'-kinase [FCB group bacterium]|jgi:tetraacyldisaccharide 4'-kinase|nr:tetraacyldisaccharide 4'-kinase [FCB group bacterium]
MKHLHHLAKKIRKGEKIPAAWGALLTALTPITRLGMQLRLARKRTRVKAHVVSFGNITAGGTGKTPAVIERARAETLAGRRVAVLTRGYGTGDSSIFAVGPDEPDSPEWARVLGDEPALIRRRVPGVAVVKGADRVAAAQLAVERFGCDVLILDDGFQYVLLERDENILLIDATNPFGNGRLIPRGILREPLIALSRATHFVLTRCDQASDLGGLLRTLEKLAPGRPIRKTRHAPVALRRLSDSASLPLETLRGRAIAAACAIGNPDAFFATLERLGARLVETYPYRDHSSFTVTSAYPIVITEKDAVRLANAPENIWALEIALEDVE